MLVVMADAGILSVGVTTHTKKHPVTSPAAGNDSPYYLLALEVYRTIKTP